MSEQMPREIQDSKDPEFYMRINVKKGAKDYMSEATVSVRYEGDSNQAKLMVRKLLRDADAEIRREIEIRRDLDAREYSNGD